MEDRSRSAREVAMLDHIEVRIDPTECALTGYCVEVAPSMFNIPTNAMAAVVTTPWPNAVADVALAREAEGYCPTRAIKLLAQKESPSDGER